MWQKHEVKKNKENWFCVSSFMIYLVISLKHIQIPRIFWDMRKNFKKKKNQAKEEEEEEKSGGRPKSVNI